MESVESVDTPSNPIQPTGPRRLYRSRTDRTVAGVCGGVAEYFGIDPVFVRLATVALFVLGFGFFLYPIAMLIVPKEPRERARARRDGLAQDSRHFRRRERHADREGRRFGPGGRGNATQQQGDGAEHRDHNLAIAGYALLAIGAVAMANKIGIGISGEHTMPLLLIGGGLAVLWRRRQDGVNTGPAAPPIPEERPSGPSTGIPTRDDLVAEALRELHHPVEDEFLPFSPPTPSTPPLVPRVHRLERRPRRYRLRVAGATLGVIAMFVGGISALELTGLMTATPEAVTGGALVILGCGLIAGAWFGRPPLFVPLGLLLAIALTAMRIADVPWHSPIGTAGFAPTTVGEVQRSYKLAAGKLTVDLRNIRPARGETVSTLIKVGAGEIALSLPTGPDAPTVEIDAHAGGGHLVVLGRESAGLQTDRTLTRKGGGNGVVHVRVDVGFGQVEVVAGEPFKFVTPTTTTETLR